MAAMLDRSVGLGTRTFDVVAARAEQRARAVVPPPWAGGTVTDLLVPRPAGELAVPVRLYRPAGPDVAYPLVFFHGGGWVAGSLDTHDNVCRELATGSGAAVVAVDYRLAPEHPFPAALDDGYAVIGWIRDRAADLGVDAARMGVCGDSAGANLAAVLPMVLRDRGARQVDLQALFYPVTDASLASASYAEFADGGGYVTRSQMAWFWEQYLDGADPDDPYASPVRGDVNGLPAALVMVAECDPLRDEGVAYAARLAAGGIDVDMVRCDGLYHGFLGLVGLLDEARAACDQACEWIRRTLGRARSGGVGGAGPGSGVAG